MAIQINIAQDKRKQSNNLWYGRTVKLNTIDTRALAKRIQASVSVKESDVYAVLIELAEVMAYELSNSNQIHLERFGYFYPSIRSTGALTKDEFSIVENVKDGRVRFKEEYTRVKDGTTGKSHLSSRALTDSWHYSILQLAETVKPTP